jgi:hypothetical protein
MMDSRKNASIFCKIPYFTCIFVFMTLISDLEAMDTANLKILQWNSNSALCHKGEIEFLLKEHCINIAALSETRFNPFHDVTFNNYSVIRDDRIARGGGGSAILVHNSIEYTELNIVLSNDFMINEINVTGIQVKLRSKIINIFSVYAPPPHKVDNTMWTQLFSSFNLPFMVFGDFNAHHMSWGNEFNDFKGNELHTFVEDNNLVVLNSGAYTYYSGFPLRKSAIDLSIVSSSLAASCD